MLRNGFGESLHASDLRGRTDTVPEIEDVSGMRRHTVQQVAGGGTDRCGIRVEEAGVEVALDGDVGAETVLGLDEVEGMI